MAAYRDAGYDFLALTDHRKVTSVAHAPEGLVAIPGIELDYVLSNQWVHLLGLGVSQEIEQRCMPRGTVQEGIDLIHACGGLAVLKDVYKRQVYEKVIRQRVMNELPFMATENIMMDAVKKGGNRQELHEKLRVHSQAAARVVKEEGGRNDLVERIAADPAFMVTREEIEAILQPEKFIGRSKEQVEEYLAGIITPLLQENKELLGEKQELSV